MNKTTYGTLRVKTLKFRPSDDVGKRLCDCRKFLGKKGTEVNSISPYIGYNGGDTRLDTVLKYSKDLGIREIKLITGVGTRTKVYGDRDTIGRKLKAIRVDKGMTLNDVRGLNHTTVRNLEEHKNNSGIAYYMKLMESIGVNELRIFV